MARLSARLFLECNIRSAINVSKGRYGMLNKFLPDDLIRNAEIQTPVLKIRGKILIHGNVIYQIHNISSIGLVDLTTKRVMPTFYWILLIFSALCLFAPDTTTKSVGFCLLCLVVWLFFKHNSNKTTERYGITIHTNSGDNTILFSRSKDFVKSVILTLYKAMNSNELSSININLDTLDMSDNSVQIGTNIGGHVVTGSVSGDVVGQV
jgi:hypothetical protein